MKIKINGSAPVENVYWPPWECSTADISSSLSRRANTRKIILRFPQRWQIHMFSSVEKIKTNLDGVWQFTEVTVMFFLENTVTAQNARCFAMELSADNVL